ncbi:MAG: phosphate ABC transporter substrate-binding protein PstS [Proteobacteria bacterium]|nr:phosphate ABC transporter substrate-binding protein PstS [Pseudomonadota bacterium]
MNKYETRAGCQRDCSRVPFGILATLCVATWVVPVRAQTPLRGVGTTFASPILEVWTRAYEEVTDERVEYENATPGAELPITARRADFVVSDAPETLSAAAAEPGRYPLVIGGIVPIANIDGIAAGRLRLSGTVLADIYLGRIRNWNDDAIQRLNPATALPNANITVVHRSDVSSGSQVLTRYLANESNLWRFQVGMSVRPKWPIGVGGTGNEGVASLVQRTRFSIGYADYFYVRQHRLRDITLDVGGERSVRATHDSIRAAVHSTGTEGWPMFSLSSLQIGQFIAEDVSRQRALARFACWAVTQGATVARDRYFIIPPDHSRSYCH